MSKPLRIKYDYDLGILWTEHRKLTQEEIDQHNRHRSEMRRARNKQYIYHLIAITIALSLTVIMALVMPTK